jgi:prepilin-type N-terminal cleavage/methylation domain-containing protein
VRRLRRDDGFTLVELLVSMLIGSIVLMGALTIVDQATPANNRIADRVAADGRARTGLEQVLQDLNSTVCVQTTATSAYQAPFDLPTDDNQATIYVQTVGSPTGSGVTYADPARSGSWAPEKRNVQVTGGRIVETTTARWNNATQTWATLSPATTRVISSNVSPVVVGGVAQPYFTYYGYDATTGQLDNKLTTPLSAADAARVVRIDVAFSTGPAKRSNGGTTSDQDTALQGSANVPVPADLTDATSSAKGPLCNF